MDLKRYIHLFSVLIALTFVRCSDSEERKSTSPKSPRIRKQIELISPTSSSVIRLSDDITIEVRHKEEKAIDSILVVTNNKREYYIGNETTITSSHMSVGKPKISVTAFFGSKKETIYPPITLLARSSPMDYAYRIIAEFDHDESAYTQGLFFEGDTIFESTGEKRSIKPSSTSSLRKVNMTTGEIYEKIELADQFFGEGCTMWNEKIYQITYTSQKAFVYDRNFTKLQEFNYVTSTSEGWGLTTYGDTLLMTDGSERIYFINPLDFSPYKELQVYDDNKKVNYLNELEIVNGELLANVYLEEFIVAIDLLTGEVTKKIYFDNMVDRSKYRGPDFALNGIALHEENRLFVTGKWWPKVFEVVIFPKERS